MLQFFDFLFFKKKSLNNSSVGKDVEVKNMTFDKTTNCQDCGKTFTYEKKRGPQRKFCDECNIKKKKEKMALFLTKKNDELLQ